MYPPVTIIVGSGRSGSTWLAEAMQKCGYSTFGELHIIAAFAKQVGRPDTRVEPSQAVGRMFAHKAFPKRFVRSLSQADVLARVREPTLRGVSYAFLEAFAASRGSDKLAWKNPVDSFHVPLLAQLLPSALFVHLIRDGHDVAASVIPLWWGACNLYTGGRYWRSAVESVWRAKPAVEGRYHEVRFEDLMSCECAAERLGEFMGADERFSALVASTRKADRKQAWKAKMTKDQIRLVEAGCQETLIAAGYETEFDGQAKLPAAVRGMLHGQDLASRVVRRVGRRLGK